MSVPESSPRETNTAFDSTILRKAARMSFMPATFAGSALGPTSTKSLYITSRRFTPNPCATNRSSSGRLCTSTTSTSPFSPSFIALPVPTEITCTLSPLSDSNFGSRKRSNPELSVLVVVASRNVPSAAAMEPAGDAAMRIQDRRETRKRCKA